MITPGQNSSEGQKYRLIEPSQNDNIPTIQEPPNSLGRMLEIQGQSVDDEKDLVVGDENNYVTQDEKKHLLHDSKTGQVLDTVQDPEYVFNPILYTRGVEAEAFYLILSGKVTVCSGNEGFMITQSSFNYLGVEALMRANYKPDFSAKVIEQARILRISRSEYQRALER